MIFRMSSSNVHPDEYGPRLYSYLERHWRAAGTNANAWVNQHPTLQGPTVSRWKTGSVPSLAAMRAVADALDVTMLDVLVAAGVVDSAEVNHEPPEPAPPTIDAAIALDPNIHPNLRAALREIVDGFRAVEAGQTRRVRKKVAGR